jgi:hypothetical protein
MSQETRSLLYKIESSLEKLQSRINKGLNGEWVASKIKEVEMKRDEEVETIF